MRSPTRSLNLRSWVWLGIGLAVAGFLDSAYLAVGHYFSAPPPCFIVSGCEKVLSSKYSVIWGIPLANFGVAYYFILFLLLVAYLDLQKHKILVFVKRLTPIGLLTTMMFLYLQLFVIQALCIYCLISAFSSISLFFVGKKMVKLTK